MAATFNPPTGTFVFVNKQTPATVTGGPQPSMLLAPTTLDANGQPTVSPQDGNTDGDFKITYGTDAEGTSGDPFADVSVTFDLQQGPGPGWTNTGESVNYVFGMRTPALPLTLSAKEYAVNDGTKLQLEFRAFDGTETLRGSVPIRVSATENIKFYDATNTDITQGTGTGTVWGDYITGGPGPDLGTVKGYLYYDQAGIYTLTYTVMGSDETYYFNFVVAEDFPIAGGLPALNISTLSDNTLPLTGVSQLIVTLEGDTPSAYTDTTPIVLIANNIPISPFNTTFGALKKGYPIPASAFSSGVKQNTFYYIAQDKNPANAHSAVIKFSASGTPSNYPDSSASPRELDRAQLPGVATINDGTIQTGVLNVTIPKLSAGHDSLDGETGYVTVYANGYASAEDTTITKTAHIVKPFTASKTGTVVVSVPASTLQGFVGQTKSGEFSYVLIDYYVQGLAEKVYSLYPVTPGTNIATSPKGA